MSIQAVIPVLPAINIEETIMFYETKLGFRATDKGGYAILKKGNSELHFFLCTDKNLCQNAVCYIKVSDIESLYIELSAFNLISLTGRLEDKPRGMKEFSIRDNNGNLLRFTEQQ
jgi:predicted enzyme related to lactoylglutathione lyase